MANKVDTALVAGDAGAAITRDDAARSVGSTGDPAAHREKGTAQ